ncbi:MAG: Eco57I restriction-modification methylase domain-containing protein [Promethearchaeota archaeon]
MIQEEFSTQFASIYHDSMKLNAKIQNIKENNESIKKLNNEVFETLNSLLAYAFIIHEVSPKSKKIPSIFNSRKSSTIYNVDWNSMHQFLSKHLQCAPKELPGIFLSTPKKDLMNIVFDDKLVGRIQEFIFSPIFNFSIDEFPKSSGKGVDTEYLTPIIFDHLYQFNILDSELKIAHSGSYFSPISEIDYTLFFSIYYFIIGSSNTQSDQEKSDIIQYLGNLFFDGNGIGVNQSRNGTVSEDQRRIALKIFQKLQNSSILDPTCGTGNFLVLFIYHFLQIKEDCANDDLIPSNISIFGCDLRSWALKITQFRVWCLMHKYHNGEKNRSINFIQHKLSLIQGDFLIDLSNFPQFSTKYDFIIGNPPYIRHRDIKNPVKDFPSANEDYRRTIHDLITKVGLRQTVQFSNRLDYSLYFFVFSLEYLKPHGILAFISSNSWMNVRYGYEFQKYLLSQANIWQIADNSYRSFKSAEINTVISFLGNNQDRTSKPITASFVKWSIPYDGINKKNIVSLLKKRSQINLEKHPYSSLISESARSTENELHYDYKKTEFYRLFQITQENIKEWDKHIQNSEKDNIKGKTDKTEMIYQGYRWGNYFLTAPPSFYEIISHLGTTMKYLDTYSRITRGITTNCNDFFILRKISKNTYQNGYGDEVKIESGALVPFLMSPKQVTSPKIQAGDLDTFIFYTSDSKTQLLKKGFTKTLMYIEYGENKEICVKKGSNRGKILKGVHNLASFKQKYVRNPLTWYCLKKPSNQSLNPPNKKLHKINPLRIYIQKIFNDTFKIIKISEEIIVNNTFYEIHPLHSNLVGNNLIFGILLGSLTVLCLEINGRTNFGGGALDTATFDIGKIIVPNIENITTENRGSIISQSKKLEVRKILPFHQDIRMEDKMALDDLILYLSHLTLSREQLYQDIDRIQRERIKKSKTFEK